MPFNRRRPRGWFFFFALMALIMVFLIGGLVMWLWNAILPKVLSVQPITYWQAVGLLVLSRILFGRFWGGSYRGGRQMRGGPWRDKWMKMTPEERKQFTQEWKNRCSPNRRKEDTSPGSASGGEG
jgi:hypothetical protein